MFRRSASTNNLATPASRAPFKSSFGGGMVHRRSTSTDRPRISDVRSSAIGGGSVSKAFYGSGRPSSQYGRSNIPAKDPRQLSDVATRSKYASELYEFLKTYNYTVALTEADLRMPKTTALVVQIFEFLYKFIENDFVAKGKLEEMMPKALKSVGYPYELKASTLKTVTTSGSWPNVLGALIWLKEIIQFAISCNVLKVLFPPDVEAEIYDDDNQLSSRAELNFIHLKECFTFGNGDINADFTPMDNRLRDSLVGNESVLLAKAQETNDKLQQELARLTSKPPRHVELESTYRKERENLKEMEKYVNDYAIFINNETKSYNGLKEKVADLVAETDALKHSVAVKEQTVAKQDITPADLQKMVFNRQDLERQLSNLQAELEHSQKQVWDIQTTLAVETDELEAMGREFVERASALLHQIFDAHVVEESGLDRFSVSDPKFESAYTKTYMPIIKRTKKNFIDRVQKVQTQIVEVKKKLADLKLEQNTLEAEANELAAKTKALEKQCEDLKREKADEIAQLKEELYELEASEKEQTRIRGLTVDDLSKEKEKLEKEKNEKILVMKNKLRARNREVMNFMDQVTNFQEKLKEMKANVVSKVDETQAVVEKNSYERRFKDPK